MMVLCLVACAAAPARAPTALKGSGVVSVPLHLGETSSGGELLGHAMPVYPASMLKTCPALQEVEVLVSVDVAGTVSDVRGVAVDAFAPLWDTFYAAVRPAVLRWRFQPLRVGRWAADAEGNAHAVDDGVGPFKRIYLFRFACHAGRADVSFEPEGRVFTD
jgi:hypothetical protein